MARIAPFRALRYNLDLVGTLGGVLAPPYDVISLEEQDQLYQTSPYNVVRLIYGKEMPGDDERRNRYTRAKASYDQWRREGLLVRDPAPAVYLCEHTFVWQQRPRRRLGLLALLQFDGSTILRHERTFEGPKADRAKLLDVVHANLDPVFCIAPDPQKVVYPLLDQATRAQEPVIDARFRGDRIRVWALTDPMIIHDIQRHLAPQSVLIADGHHRFEVASSRRDLSPAVMTYVALREDPELVLRPIHRVLSLDPKALAGIRAKVEQLCHLELMDSPGSLMAWLDVQRSAGCFGYADHAGCYTAAMQLDELAEWLAHPTVPSALAGLDVSILHHRLLAGMGIAASKDVCAYTPDHEQAIALSRQAGGCAWLLRPIPLAQVFDIAGAGFALPQKSTYFYPKVLSGLVINPFDDE